MTDHSILFQIFVYLSAAVLSVPLAKKLGLGSVLGYLIAGVLIGPHVMGLVGDSGKDALHVGEFGVIMMLFLIGLELRPAMIWKLRKAILGMGGLQLVLTCVLISGLLMISAMPHREAIASGLILALSSTAIALQMLKEKNLLKTLGGQNSFSVLLFQDIAVIPILAFLPFLADVSPSPAAHTTPSNLIENLPFWGQTLVVLLVVCAIIGSGRYAMTPVFRLIAKTRLRELFTAASLLLVVSITLIMTTIGLSPALGTFLAGVILAQNEYRHELESEIEPFKGLFLGLFFTAVGVSIDFPLIFDHGAIITFSVVVYVLIKFLVLAGIARVFGMCLDNTLLFGFVLAQGGEFSFVLTTFATQHAVISPESAALLNAVVVLSMTATPVLMLVNDRIIRPRFGTTETVETPADEIASTHPVIIAGFGKVGSVIGRFLRANGQKATFLDMDPDNVELLRKMGLKVFYGDASRPDLLIAAGAQTARILVIAVDNPDKTVEIADTAKKHFPHLTIIARTHGWNDSHELIDMGIDQVFRDTLDSSLRMASEVLVAMGYRKYQTANSVRTFRRHDEQYLRELTTVRHDQDRYIHETTQRIKALEQILMLEHENIGKDKELGWDVSAIIDDFRSTAKESE